MSEVVSDKVSYIEASLLKNKEKSLGFREMGKGLAFEKGYFRVNG